MSIETATAEHFFVARWGNPEDADFSRIVAEVKALRQRTGQEVLYLAIMPEGMPRVDQATSKKLMKLVEDILPLCSMVCIAMEMRGFHNAIIRSAMTAVTLVTRRHDKLKFVDTIEKALAACESLHLDDRAAMAKAIESTGGAIPTGFAA